MTGCLLMAAHHFDHVVHVIAVEAAGGGDEDIVFVAHLEIADPEETP